MYNDVVQDVNVHGEGVVSAKTGEPGDCLSKFLSECATETHIKESDTLEVLLVGNETQLRGDNATLVIVKTAKRAEGCAEGADESA